MVIFLLMIFLLTTQCTFLKKFFGSNEEGLRQIPESVDYASADQSDALFWKSRDLTSNRVCYYRDFIHSEIGVPYEHLSNSRPLTRMSVEPETLVQELTELSEVSANEIVAFLEKGMIELSVQVPSEVNSKSVQEINYFVLLSNQKFSQNAGMSVLERKRQLNAQDDSVITKILRAFHKRLLTEYQVEEEFLCDPDSSVMRYVMMSPEFKSGTERLKQLSEQSCSSLSCDKEFVLDNYQEKMTDPYALLYCEALKSDQGCYDCPQCDSMDLQCLASRQQCPGYSQLVQVLK